MKMSENNDYIQLPPLKQDTPSDMLAFMWEYMKVPENSREKVKYLLKDANENGVKLSHQAPTLYDVVPKEEIAEFEELMRKTIADITPPPITHTFFAPSKSVALPRGPTKSSSASPSLSCDKSKMCIRDSIIIISHNAVFVNEKKVNICRISRKVAQTAENRVFKAFLP